MRRIMKEHPESILVLIVGVIVMVFMFLPLFAPSQKGDDTAWESSRSVRSAHAMRPPSLRLEVIGRELLSITSKTAPVQFASGVSRRAVNVFVFFEGEDCRWDPHSDPTQDVGATFIDGKHFWMEEEEISGSSFVLDRGAAATGTSAFAIYYGRVS